MGIVLGALACEQPDGAPPATDDDALPENAGFSGSDVPPMATQDCSAVPPAMPPDDAVPEPKACDCETIPDAGRDLGMDDPAQDGGDAGETMIAVRQPEYDAEGQLIRPKDAEDWVFMGSGVNLNYIALPPGLVIDVLTVTLMEPTAHRHFQQTGTFAEGTMTALMVYALASGAPPSEHGQYPGDPLAFEMSVKDSAVHGADAWGYYGFALDGQRAAVQPATECNACHRDSAATDFVFTQFYPRMRSTTP
jgi:hypothetical protein